MSVLDAPKESLDPAIWDTQETPQLRKDVVDELQNRLHEWLAAHGYSANVIKGLFLIGSEATRQYTSISDLDIDVLIDTDKLGVDLETLKHQIIHSDLNGRSLGDTQHPINYYVKDSNVPLNEAEAVYDILDGVWIQTPPELPSIFDPREYFSEVIGYAKTVAEKIDVLLAQTRQLLIDYFEFEEETLRQRVESNVAELIDLLRTLRQRRHRAFEAQDIAIPFGFSRNWMPANVVFKFLEKYGYLRILMKLEDLYEMTEGKVNLKDLQRIISAFTTLALEAQSVGAVVERVVHDLGLPQEWWQDDDLRAIVEELATLLGKTETQVHNYIHSTFLEGVMDMIGDVVEEWHLSSDWVDSPLWRRKVATYVASLSKLSPLALLEIIRDHILRGSYTEAFKQAKVCLGYPLKPWAESLRISEKWYDF